MSHQQTDNPLAHERDAELALDVKIYVVDCSCQQAEEYLLEFIDVVDHHLSSEGGSSYQLRSIVNKVSERVHDISIKWMKVHGSLMIQDALS